MGMVYARLQSLPQWAKTLHICEWAPSLSMIKDATCNIFSIGKILLNHREETMPVLSIVNFMFYDINEVHLE